MELGDQRNAGQGDQEAVFPRSLVRESELELWPLRLIPRLV